MISTVNRAKVGLGQSPISNFRLVGGVACVGGSNKVGSLEG